MSSTSNKSADEYAAALGSFIKAIHKANDSYWYPVYLKPNDYASSIDTSAEVDEEEKTKQTKEKKRLQQLYPSSLEARTSLKEQYNKACVTIGLLKQHGNDYRVDRDRWIELLNSLEIEYEFDMANITKGYRGKHYYLRVGPRKEGYCKTALLQYNKEKYNPPRLNEGNISPLQRDLRDVMLSTCTSEDDSSDGTSDDSGSSEDEDETENNTLSESSSNNKDAPCNTYHVMTSLGMKPSDLSESQIECLIGELVSLQRFRKVESLQRLRKQSTLDTDPPTLDTAPPIANTTQQTNEESTTATGTDEGPAKKKAKKEPIPTSFTFTQGSGGNRFSAVPIPVPVHKSSKRDKSYNRYLYHAAYDKEIVEQMGKSKGKATLDPKLGATRLLKYLAKNHPGEYFEVAKMFGMKAIGKLDAVSLAAWKIDASMKDWQVIKSLKHLRNGLGGADVSVPFIHIKEFSKGYVEPRTKRFKHVYDDGAFEWVEVEYQPVDEVLPIVVGELLVEEKADHNEVTHVKFALGGDHGQGAFRLCFRVIITLSCGKMIYRDYGGLATVKSLAFHSC